MNKLILQLSKAFEKHPRQALFIFQRSGRSSCRRQFGVRGAVRTELQLEKHDPVQIHLIELDEPNLVHHFMQSDWKWSARAAIDADTGRRGVRVERTPLFR